jgi:hypothetical protein
MQIECRTGLEEDSNFYVGKGANSRGFYELSGDAVLSTAGSSWHEYIGYSGEGEFTQTGGTHTTSNPLYLGYNSGASASYSLSLGSLNVHGSEYVGYSGAGAFTQTGGSHVLNSGLYIGYNSGATGTYSLSAGDLSTNAYEEVGVYGTGSFAQTGGTHEVGDMLDLGEKAGGRGSYDFSLGDLTVSGCERIGMNGTGEFTQTGGTNSPAWSIILGQYAGSSGTYRLGGTGILKSGIGMWVTSVGDKGTGTFIQTGGTHSVSWVMRLGVSVGSGAYELSGNGILNVGSSADSSSEEDIGFSGSGEFTQTGGTHTVNGELALGYNKNSTGTYDLSSGDLIVMSHEDIGLSGTGTFTQSGGTHTVNGFVRLGYNSGSTGTYSLSSGDLIVMSNEDIGVSGTSTFTQTGGTHRVAGNLVIGSGSVYDLQGGTLTVAGSVTGSGFLALDGGAFSLGGNVAGPFTWKSGTLSFPGASGLTISPSGALGTSLTLGAGKTLNVTNTATVASGATLTVDGGAFSAATLSNSGTLGWNSGTMSVQDIEIGGTSSRFSVGQTAQFGGTLHANGGAVEVDPGDTLTLLGEFGTTLGQKTITKDGAGTLRIEGAQVYAAGSIFSVAEGTVFMDTAAGDATTHNLEVDVGGGGASALVVFEADEYLTMLHIMGGGEARLGDGCHVVVLDTLWIDGVGEFQNITLTGTPEPATLALLGLGGLAAMARRRVRRPC